jgi:methionine-rich copper-binding protein CopC
MSKAVFSTCLAVALTAVVGAQDKEATTSKMDNMAMERTYSGCVESSETGSYNLTHVMIADAKKPMMKTDSMKKNDTMGKDMMAASSLSLSATTVDLSKYAGRRVTVTGSDGDSMNGMATFKVKSLKVIRASCS